MKFEFRHGFTSARLAAGAPGRAPRLCAGRNRPVLVRCARTLVALFLLEGFAVASPPPACGEERARSVVRDGASAYLQAGLSTARPHVGGAAVGASVVVPLSQRLALEGSGAYLDRGAGASAMTLSANAVLQLASGHERAAPYLVAGGGVYRASFDASHARFTGPAPSGEMRTGRYRHLMEGSPPGWNLGQLPPFYGERLAAAIARNGRTGDQSFTDPALGLGAGIRIRLARAWSMRQDARIEIVMRGGSLYPVGVFTVQVGR